MQELGRHVSDQTQILFGAAVDARLGDRLSVTIISSLSGEDESDLLQAPPAANNAAAVSPVREQYEAAEPEPEIQPEESAVEIQTLEETIAFEEPVAAETEPPVSSEPPEIPSRNGKPERATITQQEKSVPWTEEKELIEKSVAPPKQEVLQFEPVTRGRFEKSEPTIIEGEDLDVPTYLRKHIKVK
jgi:cell division protein FtsZ